MASRSFTFTRWASVSPSAGWQFGSGRFTADDRADLVGYHPSNGTLWVGRNTGTAFDFGPWATVDPVDGWRFVVDTFDADLWSDAVGYHPSNGTLWLGRASSRPIEGYCWPLSAAPGQHVSFMLSGTGAGTATFRRHTSTSADVQSVQAGSASFAASHQSVPPHVYRSGAGWTPTFTLEIPQSWQSGIYSAQCVDGEGAAADITFVVKPGSGAPGKVAVLANVNTWLAYNGWGGHSKYTRLARAKVGV